MQNCRTAPRSYCRFIKIFRGYFFKHSVHVSLSLDIFFPRDKCSFNRVTQSRGIQGLTSTDYTSAPSSLSIKKISKNILYALKHSISSRKINFQ